MILPFARLSSLLALAALLSASASCSDDDTTAGATTASGSSSSSSSGSGGGTELTLDNCVTDIASDVPAFYKTYFRCVEISMSGATVVLASDGLPPHRSYYYGEGHANFSDFDSAGGRSPNPNQLAAQTISIEIPAAPTAKGLTVDASLVDGDAGTSAEEYPGGPIGLALDGVALFSGLAAPGDSLENEALTFDSYNAHPEMRGAYHYHGITPGPLEALATAGLVSNATPGSAEIEVYGVLCDGTLILGCTELDGSAPNGGDFDAQNGHVHDISDGTTVHFAARYHTHICPGSFPAHPYTPEIQHHGDGCPAPMMGP